ncbi:hypothetical protein [Runella sp. SP2]|uniref:putative polyvalent protein kinase domain-containing protein n=1 Tax=Runella sp. SP2 TaxID=2268026 RepID=UPI000F07E518|nr:hypothetical protein [Runella sp. SP2]AYQ34780.1 hypothetical protein DTQ70_22555 [Runella sp. SP2]
MTDELRHILEGTGRITETDLIQTTLFYLRKGQTASGKIEKSKFVNKEDEVKHLTTFASRYHLWYTAIPQNAYIGEGNDFFHPELGIILEDLHDENVLTNQGLFFFIDSAIYLITH